MNQLTIADISRSVAVGAERAAEKTDSEAYFGRYFFGWVMELFEKGMDDGEEKEEFLQRMKESYPGKP